ncbi:MAG: UbiX family flavin prenyltransferase [Syntrophomonadaceae bacterium]|nr:UbiX family flavin prenyltransferase [Syntrophomonadaceae bacterium]
MPKIVVGLTGASGIVYGIRLVEELLKRDFEVHLVVSNPAKLVLEHELSWDFSDSISTTFQQKLSNNNLFIYNNSDIAAPIASGSFLVESMIVIPCTMSTVSNIANGTSNSLLERAADVVLKERKSLIIVPRETPLSSIHLKNMLALSDMGVHIIPAMPAFYNHPQNIEDMIDFVVGKVLDSLKIEHGLYKRYS